MALNKNDNTQLSLKKKPVLKGDKVSGDIRPFGLLWLDSLYQEIFLPNGEWQKVLLKVNEALCVRIQKQFDMPERKQMIFELMGQDYVNVYFPEHKYDPTIIEPPAISKEERRKLQVDAQNWLQKEMIKVCTETGCERPMPGQLQAPVSPEMQKFLQFVRFLIAQSVDRHLYLQEKEIMRAWESFQWEQELDKRADDDIRKQIRLKREYERITGATPAIPRDGTTPFTNKPPPTAGSVFTVSSETNRITSNVKGAMYGTSDDPPTFWGMQSNSLGRSIVAILKRDPRRYGEVAARLHGRQLPSTLRMYIWLDMLLRQERERLKDSNVERHVRERFGKALSRGISDLKVKRATHSPISGLIDNAVIEIYDNTPAMRMFLDYDVHMKETTKALNILYTYDRTYEPYLIHWLFPIQMAYQDFSGQSEHVYDLAMYLDLLNNGCFPKWPSVFAIAERAMLRVEKIDKELHDHLEHISLRNVNINPKEFMVQLIHEEQARAQELLASTPTKSLQKSKDLLANPLIFLRKWVGEGFASVLDTQAVLYVWDQCFLQRWSPRVLEDFCIVLLLLLRHKFIEASDYREMSRIFLREPCVLYTMDIQRAWIHLQRDGDAALIPTMNRQAYDVPKPWIDSVAASPAPPQPGFNSQGPSPQPSILVPKPVPTVGIKHLRLEMDIPKTSSLFATGIKTSSVVLECLLYFGSVHIGKKRSTVLPASVGTQDDVNGTKTARVQFPKQKFVFDGFDSGQYDLEQEMGGAPYAVIQVLSETTANDQVTSRLPIGWTRIRLFQHKSEVEGWADPTGLSQWVLLTGEFKQKLVSGEALEYGNAQGQSPPQALIGGDSWLNSLVFDPHNEPATPPPTVPPNPPSQTPPTPVMRSPTPQPAQSQPAPSPGLPGISNKFVLYVDGVDNIPDNATITKVTGRVVKTGSMTGLADVLALPELSSRARCPRFVYKYVINENDVKTDISMLILLRVYTVDRMSGELKVIGSCLGPVFNQQTGKVLVGRHQKVLHYGMPDLKKGLAKMTSASMDSHARVPGCTIYYRFDRFTQEHVPAPALTRDNYPLEDAGFNQSEQRVLDSYKKDTKHPKTIADMITLLQRLEKVNTTESALAWLEGRLDQKKHLRSMAAGYLDLVHMVHYRLDKGINIAIARAYGLPEGMYIQCFARVYPGSEAQGQPVTSEGHGRDDEQMVTLKTDLDSYQAAPKWTDPPKTIHPHWDIHTTLLVQLFGLNIKYTADANHKTAGQLTSRDGQPLKLGPENILGWTMVPLFNDVYAHIGEHHVPLLQGQPDQMIMSECSKRSIVDVIRDTPAYRDKLMGNSTLVVRIWDGHFSDLELLEPLSRQQELLEAAGTVESSAKVETPKQGQKLNQFILESLSKKEQKQGISGQAYFKEKVFFSQTIEKTFYDLMEDALMQAGYGPL